jgi:hypothetical protein
VFVFNVTIYVPPGTNRAWSLHSRCIFGVQSMHPRALGLWPEGYGTTILPPATCWLYRWYVVSTSINTTNAVGSNEFDASLANALSLAGT